MRKQTLQFVTVSKNGVVDKIGRSSILQPKVNYKPQRETKWFDESKLLKKNRQQCVKCNC